MDRRKFLDVAARGAAAAAWAGSLDAAPEAGTDRPKLIIPTDIPDRFKVKVMEFNPVPPIDPKAPTAAIFVASYGGVGIHTVLNVFRAFPGHFKNVVFLSVGVAVSAVGERAARRTVLAARSQAEAEALARLAASSVLSVGEEALPNLVTQLRDTFGLTAVAVLCPDPPGWRVEAAAGDPVPTRPEEASFSAPLDEGSVLALAGGELMGDDARLLNSFVAQLRVAQAGRRLLAEAASAGELAESNRLRTALLAAVSHDLRTPLASIKASASSLLSDEVEWSRDAIKGFARTIEGEADRLNAVVSNLLDMSRLHTGALHLKLRPVGLEEVVSAALGSLSSEVAGVAVDVPDTLPAIEADPALLERAVANVVENALSWSPPERQVRVEAGEVGDRVDLRIIDRGPGIPVTERDRVFQPFQRFGDGGRVSPNGVGLGLAVARGFVEAMGGELLIEDTPGGGTTMVLSLRRAHW